jgi:hypothetical protein
MPEHKHTPGPWKYEEETQTIRSTPSNHWLASMDSWDGAVDHAADARLIAAAPEMLEALEYILAWTPQGWDVEKARDMARNAIAKAKGEE